MEKAAAEVAAEPWRVGLAIIVGKHMAQRCRCPMPSDPRFAVQNYYAMRDANYQLLDEPKDRGAHAYGNAAGTKFKSWVAPQWGQLRGCAVSGFTEDHLATETKRFMEAT
jgi:hypothetical protein